MFLFSGYIAEVLLNICLFFGSSAKHTSPSFFDHLTFRENWAKVYIVDYMMNLLNTFPFLNVAKRFYLLNMCHSLPDCRCYCSASVLVQQSCRRIPMREGTVFRSINVQSLLLGVSVYGIGFFLGSFLFPCAFPLSRSLGFSNFLSVSPPLLFLFPKQKQPLSNLLNKQTYWANCEGR